MRLPRRVRLAMTAKKLDVTPHILNTNKKLP